MGWVNRRRDLGNLIFIDLRDRTGITQIVFDTDKKDVLEKASHLRNEYVIAVTGGVKRRDLPRVRGRHLRAPGDRSIGAGEVFDSKERANWVDLGATGGCRQVQMIEPRVGQPFNDRFR